MAATSSLVPNFDAPAITRAPSMDAVAASASSSTSSAASSASSSIPTIVAGASKRTARVLEASQLALHAFMHSLLHRFRVDPITHLGSCSLVELTNDHDDKDNNGDHDNRSNDTTLTTTTTNDRESKSFNKEHETTLPSVTSIVEAPSITPPVTVDTIVIATGNENKENGGALDDNGVPLPPPIAPSLLESKSTVIEPSTQPTGQDQWWREGRKNYSSGNIPSSLPPPPHDIGNGPEAMIKLLPLELRTLLLSWLWHAGGVSVALFDFFVLPDMQHVLIKNGNANMPSISFATLTFQLMN
jgi:hypothetical protein